MLNLIRLSILALFTFANPALALAYCKVPIFFPTLTELRDCVEHQAFEISLQASEISRLRTEIDILRINLEMKIDTLRTEISTLEMQIPRPRTYRPPLNKRVSPKDTKIQPEKN
jgi:hypothetical protein